MSIESAVGRGTRVTLITPYWPARPNGASAEQWAPNAASSSQSRSHESTTSPGHSAHKVQDSALHEKSRIRVMLVDDHAMVRQGLRSVLESYPDIEVVGEASEPFYLDGAMPVSVNGASHGSGFFKYTNDLERRGMFKFVDCDDTFLISCTVSRDVRPLSLVFLRKMV